MDREMKVLSGKVSYYSGWIINHKGCQSPYPQKAMEEFILVNIINNQCVVNAYATRQ